MKDGSVASITYVANGDKSFPRERIEIFGGGKVCVIDDFKVINFIYNGKKKSMKKFGIDRGYYNEFEAFFSAVKKGKPIPVDFEEYVFTTLATFSIMESIRTGAPVDIDQSILTEAFPPEIRSASHLLYELADSLVEKGFQVTVITRCPKNYLDTVERKYQGRYLHYEKMKGIKVIRLFSISFLRSIPIIRGLDQFLL